MLQVLCLYLNNINLNYRCFKCDGTYMVKDSL